MVITTKQGNRYAASTVMEGVPKWGEGGERGVLVYCTDAVIHIPYSDVESIQLDNGDNFERRLPPVNEAAG